jgi:hypothetical protein
MGRERYPNAKSLLITADGGGSNGSRVRLWKLELQKLADDLAVPITVCHLPPGTSSRVDDWRGSGRSRGVAVVRQLSLFAGASGQDHGSVSSRRSSNRTCRSPASGFHPRRQAFALGKSARRNGKAYRPSVS